MRILIVDDSIVFRTAIKTCLMDSKSVEEIAVAANGKIACEKLKLSKFDGVTLDLEMPVMDGIETIKKIREFDKDIPIIIFSAQNINAANKTLKALEMGANDFVQKLQDSNDVNENLKMIQKDLVPKLEALVARKQQNVLPHIAPEKINHKLSNLDSFRPNLICIGSSTGGPDMLMKVFSQLKEIRVPILLVQHMPPMFTTQLAKTLNENSSVKVVEAKVGDVLEPGTCYIAPGDFHMTIKPHNGNYLISLDQSEKVCFVRPAVDVLLNSVATNFSGKVASFIFTGMGNDGADGNASLKKKSSSDNVVFIQDEKSSVVWGMPRAVFDMNVYDDILNPDEIVSVINKFGA